MNNGDNQSQIKSISEVIPLASYFAQKPQSSTANFTNSTPQSNNVSGDDNKAKLIYYVLQTLIIVTFIYSAFVAWILTSWVDNNIIINSAIASAVVSAILYFIPARERYARDLKYKKELREEWRLLCYKVFDERRVRKYLPFPSFAYLNDAVPEFGLTPETYEKARQIYIEFFASNIRPLNWDLSKANSDNDDVRLSYYAVQAIISATGSDPLNFNKCGGGK